MTATLNDYARQSANLVLPPLMWVLSSLGIFYDGARSPSEFSDMSANLLVPSGIAFSIWFPIFIGCIAYGVLQALPRNRTREIFRQIGWWTIAGFLCVCGWSLISSFAPGNYVQWSTALIFIPTVLCLVKAMLILSRRRKDFTTTEKVLVAVPIALIAGWTSIAVFLNWTPIAYDAVASAAGLTATSLMVLALALLWAIFIIRKSGRNRFYALPIIWGLFFLAFRHFQSSENITIAYAALIGIALLSLALVWRPKAIA